MTPHPATLLAEARRAPGRSLVAVGLLTGMAVTPSVFLPGLYDSFTLPKQATILLATACILAGLAIEGEFLPRHRPTRWLLLAWTALLLASFATGIDRRGSVLGYYQYRQGLLTQFGYIGFFLGATSLARHRDYGWLGFAGLVGLGSVAFYTAVQSLGLDPVNWWTDTAARAIGTIGNANELAAYAVIALALCAFADGRSRRVGAVLIASVAATSAFILLESESRGGLLALGLALVAFPLTSLMLRQPSRSWTLKWLSVLCGVAVGTALSLAAGGAGGTASRLQTGLAHPETGGSTRIELWKGTVSTIASSPLLGFGPDRLFLAFPQHRPADLGGAFLDYDLVAQSSHNAALDIAANEGLPALFAIVSLVALVGARSVRRERERPSNGGVAFVWSAMVGYLALAMFNPISLAPHALFFLFLGALQGRSEQHLPQRTAPRLPAPARLALVAPASFALVVIAVLLPVADRFANRAWDYFAAGDFQRAAAGYESASDVLPFERSYAAAVAESWLAAGVTVGEPALVKSVAAYTSFDGRFGFASGEAIGLATARVGLGETVGLARLVDRAVSLNPHGVSMAKYADTMRLAASAGGTIHYSEKDHWVYVVPRYDARAR